MESVLTINLHEVENNISFLPQNTNTRGDVLMKRADEMECCKRVRVIAISYPDTPGIVGKIIAHFPIQSCLGNVHVVIYDWTGETKVTTSSISGGGMDMLAACLEGEEFGNVKLTVNWQSDLYEAGFIVDTLL